MSTVWDYLYLTFTRDKIKIMSLNVNGLREDNRREKIIDYYIYPVNKSKKPDIFCLQECHSDEESEHMFLNAFQYDLCFAHSPHCQQVGGLITGFRRSLNYCVESHKHVAHAKSQALLILCKIEDVQYVIINYYLNPDETAEDRHMFLSSVKHEIVSLNCNRVLWCGDFNMSISFLDVSKEISFKHQQVAENHLDLIDFFDLADVFRTLNPNERRYSYMRKKYGTRLDYVFVSLDVLSSVYECDIGVAYVTDHAPVYLEVANGRNPSGRNYWKFPKYLLQCNQFKDGLREHVPHIINQNKHNVSPAVLWDIIKHAIKRFTSNFVFTKSNLKKKCIEDLECRIAELYNQLSNLMDLSTKMYANKLTLLLRIYQWYIKVFGRITI